MTHPDGEMGSQIVHVISRPGQNMYLYMHEDREERSRDQYGIPFHHHDASFLVDFCA